MNRATLARRYAPLAAVVAVQLLIIATVPSRAPSQDVTAGGPSWGRIDKPGLGVEVDEDKLMRYHQAYLRDGQFLPYGERFNGQ